MSLDFASWNQIGDRSKHPLFSNPAGDDLLNFRAVRPSPLGTQVHGRRVQTIINWLLLGAPPAAATMTWPPATTLRLPSPKSLSDSMLNVPLLYDHSKDPPTFAAVAELFLVVGLMAACVPALRASRVDPLVALRHD